MTNKVKEHWESKLYEYEEKVRLIEEGKIETDRELSYYLRTLRDLIESALRYKQYEGISPEDGHCKKCTRLCKVTLSMSKSELEKVLMAECHSVYGTGMFVPLEGYLVDKYFRDKSGYDTQRLKGHNLDLGELENEDIEKRLTIESGSGLFIPLKSKVTPFIRTARSMQVLDIRSWS